MNARNRVLAALRAEAARGGSDVGAAARAARVTRTYVYRLAGRYEDVLAALRGLQARGGRGRTQRTTERARGNLERGALVELLDRPGDAARLVALARAHGLLRAEVSTPPAS